MKTKADSIIAAIYNTSELEQQKAKAIEGSIEWLKAHDDYYQKRWMLSLKFWNEFPNDIRRVGLFTSVAEPSFYKDVMTGLKTREENRNGGGGFFLNYRAELDWRALEAYDKERIKIRNAILNDPKVDKREKHHLRKHEIGIVYIRGRNQAYREDKNFYLSKVQQAFELAISDLGKVDELDRYSDFRFIPEIFSNTSIYGYTPDNFLQFLNRYKNSSKPQVVKWIAMQMAILKLREIPFALKHISIEGKEIDLEKLRGKVVLLDFWGTWCSSCIARMPAIRAVYEKHKNAGFEVISVSLNPNIDKEKVMAVHEKIGADWPVLLTGGESNKSGFTNPNSPGQKIMDTYGFTSVPQLILLDKQGKLAMYNDLLLQVDFEPVVQKLLSE